MHYEIACCMRHTMVSREADWAVLSMATRFTLNWEELLVQSVST